MAILMSETCWVHKKWKKNSKWHQVGLLFFKDPYVWKLGKSESGDEGLHSVIKQTLFTTLCTASCIIHQSDPYVTVFYCYSSCYHYKCCRYDHLGASVKFWKAPTATWCSSVRPLLPLPIRPLETTRLHWNDFHEIWYEVFLKSAEKFQNSLQSNKNDVCCM